MSGEPSRRGLLKAGLAAAAVAAVPSISVSQIAVTPEEIEKELGHSLPEEAKKLLKSALENNRNNSKERLKTKLPDCSEPCFVYRPTGFVHQEGKK